MKSHIATPNLHVVIRAGMYADIYGEEKLKGDIVAAHCELAKRHGTVLLGKLGRLPVANKLELLTKAIEKFGNTELMIVRKHKGIFEGFCSPLYKIHTDNFVPSLSSVPAYYHHLTPNIPLWFEIGIFKLMSPERLKVEPHRTS